MNLMQKSLSVFGAASILAFSPVASAAPVAFQATAAQFSNLGLGYGIDRDEGNANLLDVRFSNAIFSTQNFALDAVSQSVTFNFGTIDLQEPDRDNGILASETDDLAVSAKLTFSAPTGIVQIVTTGGLAFVHSSVTGGAVDYVLDWAPVFVSFGNGGQYKINFNDMIFADQGTQMQTVTVTLLSLSEGQAPTTVPEPASLALFGLGIAGVALARRRRMPGRS